MPTPRRSPDVPPPYGATLTDSGAEFCVYAGHATAVTLCLFDENGAERQVPLTSRIAGAWFGHVEDVVAGQRYGYRVDGPWSPVQGHRHNPAKLLLDPYARAVDGRVDWRPEVFGHQVDEHLAALDQEPDTADSAPFVPRSVVVGPAFDWGDDRPPYRGWADTVVYEVHVEGLTRTLPGLPEHLRGTYAGLAHPVTVAHLQRVGVTAVELLPVHASTSEPRLTQLGLSNYWGYNTLGFFAPEARYASGDDPRAVVDEFRTMVRDLHRAGIEVLLDVVYNHTCEQQSATGSTLSWRGLDNRAYYRLDERSEDVDVTGCGNTVDISHPVPMQMVLDSLRHWVTEMHVDGFRFDLAAALGRDGRDAYDADNAFLMALRTDPVLSQVKLVAEPWDIGPHGWRTGAFPPPFSEWNDRYRDDVRTFWLRDVRRATSGRPGHGVRDLATRLAGSADLFDSPRRTPMASVSYVTAHDGFTLADLVSHDRKHNLANQEDDRDGSNDNHSWNHGHEGPVDPSSDIARWRRRSQRNLLATLMLSSGIPMLLGGDELGRSQRGNNNAYCQANEISWYDWDLEPWQHDLIDTTAFLVELRRTHPVLRQTTFFPRRPRPDDDRADLHWFALDGSPMTSTEWADDTRRSLAVVFDGLEVADDRLLVLLNGDAAEHTAVLPHQPGVDRWELVWGSHLERPDDLTPTVVPAGEHLTLPAASIQVLEGT